MATRVVVHSSMSPKGVEHTIEIGEWTHDGTCIHQCRRKALSTVQMRPFVRPERQVHSSMSPKGVEHERIESDGLVLAKVHSSMSPKGVEHIRSGVAQLNTAMGAFINVAERR